MSTDWRTLRSVIIFHAEGPSGTRGQTLVEYTLILALIALVLIGVLATVGLDAKGLYHQQYIGNMLGP